MGGAILGGLPGNTRVDMHPREPLASVSPPPSKGGGHGPWANPKAIRFVLRMALGPWPMVPMAPKGALDGGSRMPVAPPIWGGEYGREEAPQG